MNLRENYIKVLNDHEKTDLVPNFFTAVRGVGFGAGVGPWFEKGPLGGGYDGFGVRWVTPSSGGGAPIPAPGEFVLDDITQWKEKVKFPDVEGFDWETFAQQELEGCDRTQQVVDFGSGNGVFERLAALMGFDEALIAMATEPEATNELFAAITDYKIEVAKKVAQYYKADYFTNYDDIATERNLFMSPDTYRTLIKPHHKRLYDAIRELGMTPITHCCGRAEDIIEDMIDTGCVAWTPVQPSNDIAGLLNKYGNRIAIIGGYDSNGKAGRVDATEEEVRAEVRRCFDDYGACRGYVFMGFKMVDSLDPNDAMAALGPIIDESIKCSMQLAGMEAPPA